MPPMPGTPPMGPMAPQTPATPPATPASPLMQPQPCSKCSIPTQFHANYVSKNMLGLPGMNDIEFFVNRDNGLRKCQSFQIGMEFCATYYPDAQKMNFDVMVVRKDDLKSVNVARDEYMNIMTEGLVDDNSDEVNYNQFEDDGIYQFGGIQGNLGYEIWRNNELNNFDLNKFKYFGDFTHYFDEYVFNFKDNNKECSDKIPFLDYSLCYNKQKETVEFKKMEHKIASAHVMGSDNAYYNSMKELINNELDNLLLHFNKNRDWNEIATNKNDNNLKKCKTLYLSKLCLIKNNENIMATLRFQTFHARVKDYDYNELGIDRNQKMRSYQSQFGNELYQDSKSDMSDMSDMDEDAVDIYSDQYDESYDDNQESRNQ